MHCGAFAKFVFPLSLCWHDLHSIQHTRRAYLTDTACEPWPFHDERRKKTRFFSSILRSYCTCTRATAKTTCSTSTTVVLVFCGVCNCSCSHFREQLHLLRTSINLIYQTANWTRLTSTNKASYGTIHYQLCLKFVLILLLQLRRLFDLNFHIWSIA